MVAPRMHRSTLRIGAATAKLRNIVEGLGGVEAALATSGGDRGPHRRGDLAPKGRRVFFLGLCRRFFTALRPPDEPIPFCYRWEGSPPSPSCGRDARGEPALGRAPLARSGSHSRPRLERSGAFGLTYLPRQDITAPCSGMALGIGPR